MSERMIELQRLKLLAASKGAKAKGGTVGAATQQNGQAGSAVPGHPIAGRALATPQTPQQSATNAALSEDMEIKIFLERLQNHRDDSRAESTSGPTVPTALSRRILQQQGVGYLDSTVGAITSAMADRFLATIMQQGIICRDHRLKGAELAREAARHRRRHKRQYQEDVDDRSRRKEERAQKREKTNLAIIQAAESMKPTKGGGGSKDAEPGSGSKSKKKKPPQPNNTDEPATPVNGNKAKQKEDEDENEEADEEESYDSIDEEEEYYEEHYEDDSDDSESDIDDDEEEDEEMIILRDLERPLEAWDFSVKGKIGTDPAADNIGIDSQEGIPDDLYDDEDGMPSENDLGPGGERNYDDATGQQSQRDEPTSVATSTKSDVKSPSDEAKKAKRPSASSPVPPTSQTTNSSSK